MAKILVADDDITSVAIMKKVLEESGHSVTTVTDGKTALAKLKQVKFDVLVTDFDMPGLNGIQLTKEAIELESDLIVVLITAFVSVKQVVEAIKLGAFDYLTKPINREELVLAVNRGLEKISILNENLLLKHELEKSDLNAEKSFEYATISPELKAILNDVNKVAKSDSTVLITGENGTGKEVLAKYIYHHSKRANQPFVVVNCAAIPNQLLESELFGHAKGSFTGAINDHKGYFEIANNGTIFLDEIGDMPLDLQVKILRALQEKTIQPIGALSPRKIDFRVVAATHRNLREAAELGTFRQDLYYRLKYLTIEVAPLRERPEDIEPLVRYFINQMEEKTGLKKPISDSALRKLKSHSWPGNVRDLEAVVKKAFVMSDARITPQAFSEEIVDFKANNIEALLASGEIIKYDDFIRRVEEQERTLLLRAMELSGNVKSAAALLLGMNHNTMNYRRSVLRMEEGKQVASKAVAK